MMGECPFQLFPFRGAMQSGVHVLIVGTTRPERFKQNAELISAGPLPKELEASIRKRWKQASQGDWTGQT